VAGRDDEIAVLKANNDVKIPSDSNTQYISIG
jgi:hypothetical protein